MSYNGLTQKKARELLHQFGENRIDEKGKNSALKIFFRQIKSNFLIYILTFAAILSFFVGKEITAYTIVGVIVVVVVVGFFMEYRAEKSIAALKNMITQTSLVIRDGKEQEVESHHLVPGDIVILRTGDKVPADGIILEQKELRVNESMLTGEAKEVHKTVTPSEHSGKIIDKHKVFMGTYVVNGHCKIKVIHTGMNTEFGKIAGMITQTQKDIPLQQKVNTIVKYMSINALFFAIITGFVMAFRDAPLTTELAIEILIVVIALSVSAFPEGFPVVLITTLAGGARRMAKKNAIVNRMAIIETLGETTVICSDKTGTITKGQMTVRELFTPEHTVAISGAGYIGNGDFTIGKKKIDPNSYPHVHTLIKAGIICNDAGIEKHLDSNEYKIRGSQTEAALLVLGAKAQLYKDTFTTDRLEEIPFSSHNKTMSVLVKEQKQNNVYAKGAPEILLNRCTHYRYKNKVRALTNEKKKEFLAIVDSYTTQSYRVLALAQKQTKSTVKKQLETGLTFLGFAVMEDPPRDEAKVAIHECMQSGIAVKILTGDNKNTAGAVAKQVGLHGRVIEGFELDDMTDEELKDQIGSIQIFARVRPEHKIRIVRILKEQGEIVSMTGDGVNDAPALKESHIGIAMGKNGTDVSREVSDLILKDDNFATIVSAIVEGRTIFKNIQKVSVYQISITLAQLGFVFVAIMMGLPLPLVAMQILFINLLSDELTAIMLGFNPPSFDVLQKQPRKGSQLVDKHLAVMLFLATATVIITAVISFVYMLNVLELPLEQAQTFAFITIVFFGVTNAFNFRSFRYPVTRLPLNANVYLLAASIIAILITLLVVYTPLAIIFETAPVPGIYWLYAGLLSLIIIAVFDVFKLLNNHFKWIEVH
ncbi:MAG: cation-translocating P-type ATPase [Candidatus Woesearchaeota archaeon]